MIFRCLLLILLFLPLMSGQVFASEIDAEDYQIYSIALDQIHSVRSLPNSLPVSSVLVVGRETLSSDVVKLRPSEWISYLKNQLGVSPQRDLVNDFVAKNKMPSVLENKFTGVQTLLFLVRRTVQGELKIDWDDFRTKNRGASSLTEVSRIGFDRKKTAALLRTQTVTLATSAIHTFFCSKQSGEWKIEHQNVRIVQKKDRIFAASHR